MLLSAQTGKTRMKSPFKLQDVPVSDSDVSIYERDGVVCIKNAISIDWIEKLRVAADWVQQNPGPYDTDLTTGGKGQFYGGQFLWLRREEFKEFLFSSPIAAIVARLMASKRVQLFYDFLLTKEPGGSNKTPWHQDRLYYPLKGKGADNICSTWIALDPVTIDSGAVEYISGSHKWGHAYVPESFTFDERFDGHDDIKKLPDIDADRDQYDIKSWDLEPGDIVAHHVLNVHGAPENTADIRRRGHAIRWISGEVKFDSRPETQPILREAVENGPSPQTANQVLSGETFPVINFGDN